MKKRAKIHRLPTRKADDCIILDNATEKFKYYNGRFFTQEHLKYANQSSHHLYFTTDDEIKKGDWYVLTKNDGTPTTILKATVDGGSLKFNSEKIIATTDPELNYGMTDRGKREMQMYNDASQPFPKKPIGWYNNIPQPSKDFIEEYCRVGGIDEVNVEYGLFHDGNFKDDDETHAFKATHKPRVNSHNEIIIHSIEEKMYSEAELIQFVLDNRFNIDSDTTRDEITNWIKK